MKNNENNNFFRESTQAGHLVGVEKCDDDFLRFISYANMRECFKLNLAHRNIFALVRDLILFFNGTCARTNETPFPQTFHIISNW